MGVPFAAANGVTIAAAGGVEAIVQGMQAHVDLATVQEHGAAALWNVAANNGAELHRLWRRCVVCGVQCMAGWLWWACVRVAPSAACTRDMDLNRDDLSPMCASAFVCDGAATGLGLVGAVAWHARWLVWCVQTLTYPSRRPAAWRRSFRACRRTWEWRRCRSMAQGRCGA